jgi:hypothetical protein
MPKSRPKTAERQERREKLIRFTCDYLEGKYVLPNGKLSKPGTLNKAELLRAADYPESYKNAYTIFDREDFKADVVTEQARRRDIDANLPDVRLPGETDDDLMGKLINRELLYRLRYNPGSIEMKDLLAARNVIHKAKPKAPSEGGGKSRPTFNANQLIVMLEGKIPADVLAKLPPAPTEDVVDSTATEE